MFLLFLLLWCLSPILSLPFFSQESRWDPCWLTPPRVSARWWRSLTRRPSPASTNTTESVHRCVCLCACRRQSDGVQVFVCLAFGTEHMPAECSMHIPFGCLLWVRGIVVLWLSLCVVSLCCVFTSMVFWYCMCVYCFKINSSAALALGLWAERATSAIVDQRRRRRGGGR